MKYKDIKHRVTKEGMLTRVGSQLSIAVKQVIENQAIEDPDVHQEVIAGSKKIAEKGINRAIFGEVRKQYRAMEEDIAELLTSDKPAIHHRDTALKIMGYFEKKLELEDY